MIKPIVLYGTRSLRQNTDPIPQGTNIKDLIKNLWDTMYNAEGAGLAAPQIGMPLKAFVIDLPDQEWKKVFINPKIESISGDEESVIEGCLSLPGISAPIVRQDEIEISYFDENWKFQVERYRGIRSRVIQHEYDHLDGILWIDRVDPGIGMQLLTDLNNIIDKKVEVTYAII